MTATVGPLDRSVLADARRVLADACRFDRADVVADEKLFGDGPSGAPQPLGAWRGDQLVGVASVAANRIRVLAVAPESRRQGIGSALLDACVAAARATGQTRLRTLDQPGNYLAPGIDLANVDTIEWLERRGWARAGEQRLNVLIDVRDNPRVTAERAAASAARAGGYEIRRAHVDEAALLDAVATEFGGAWPFEVARALGRSSGGMTGDAMSATTGSPVAMFGTTASPSAMSTAIASPGVAGSPSTMLGGAPSGSGASGVHVALKDGAYCAFAAHDGNNRGLGWFGPTGTWPAHRGHGLGEALLLACLVDVAVDHARCEVAWIGPRPFYDKVAGVAADRSFVLLARDV